MAQAAGTEEPASSPAREKEFCIIGKEDIAKLRKRLKLSRRKFAELFGAGKKEAAAWESGESEPAQNQRQQLARAMAMDKRQRTPLPESFAAERQ